MPWRRQPAPEMRIDLAYGQGTLAIDLPAERTTVITPAPQSGLPDERAAVHAALARPIGAPPLREWVKPGARVCIVFTDLTRATPNHRLIPWLLEHLGDVPRGHLTLLNSTGTHRPNTRAELEQMLTPAVVRNCRVVNHECENLADLVELGRTPDGAPVLLNRHLIDTDVRIITGFIEPHVFAGFSGGSKGLVPGCAGLATVMSNHGARNLSHSRATFGITAGNPLWEELRNIALRVGPSFLLNVTLNEPRQITGVFAGDLIVAHQAGCDFVRRSAMQVVPAPFDLVITTNSGYPLDLNLYQGVKGMTAGARIVRDGGLLILACECREGVPAGSPYHRLLRQFPTPEALLAGLAQPGFCHADQWQAYLQALVQRRVRVLLHSSLSDEVAREVHLEPCHDIATTAHDYLAGLGSHARVAVLPQGPLTIPCLETSARFSA